MEVFDIPTLATGGTIALIILILGLVGLMKGMARMFFGLFALSAGALAAYWGFQRGGAIAGYIISDPDAWMSGVVGLVIGLAVFFAARATFGVLLKPTRVEDGKKKNQPLMGAIFGLLSGAVFCWFSLSSIRYVGTLVELQWINDCLAEEGKINKEPKPVLVFVRDFVDGTIVGGFHRQYDPLNNPIGAQIARLRILTEHPYAITQVSVDKGVRGAFLQADIRSFLQESADLTAFVADSKFSHLIESQSVQDLSKIPAAREALIGLEISQALGIEPEVEEQPEKEEEKAPVDPNSGAARVY